jgi:predicted nucleic acid-binding protein
VLDTNVVLDWLVFADPASAPLVRSLDSGALRLVSNAECLAELERVLAYPVLELDEARRAAALARYRERAVMEPDVLREPSGLPRCTDADDQKFLELAWHAGARWLVTKDNALLALAARVARLGRFAIVTPAGIAAALTPP